ncbi:sulfatase family protein [Lignipirellula cremea]|uniref:Arylsulfatase n=1 Tax=Lignipirellula cremea TaxID=2528010 RepID=A0A518DUW4_9BACT|nr:sulfatase [Lignipirellula cremea]QDU95623.1 Arylsulfatase [Lignipirellula cremea]
MIPHPLPQHSPGVALFRRCGARIAATGALLLAVVVVQATCALSVFAAEERPNILFIMADDHGYQAIGAYGSVVNETPNIDRIATEGMRFDRCFVTNSICGPSRAVILTGKYSHQNGFRTNGDRFDGSQQTVAKLLQKAGYQTAVVGKWHLGTDPTGFDDWHILQGQGPYYNPAMKTPEGVVKHTGYTTEIITDEALKWLQEKRDASKPFFLLYQHKAPHRNWQPGPKQLNMYDEVTIPEPQTLYDDYEGRGTPAKTQAMTVANHLSPHDLKLAPQRGFTPEQQAAWDAAYGPKNAAFQKAELSGKELIQWKFQRYAKDYLRCVASVDENVGRVLDYLDESGLAKNTIVFYTSDQGWYLGEHGWYDKRWMYEESFRTPLLVRWPGHTKPGSVDNHLVMNLDFPETFLAVAGVEIPADMQGVSIVPLLEGKAPADWRTSLYYHYYEFPGAHSVQKHEGVRTDRYKLIHFYEVNEWEFFDLQEDPNELKSVYADPAYAEEVQKAKVELERLRKRYELPVNAAPRQPRGGKKQNQPAGKKPNGQKAGGKQGGK